MSLFAPPADQSHHALYQMMGELLSVSGKLPDFTQAQWQRVIYFSGDALVVAQVYTTLSANGLFTQLPEDIRAYLQEVYELNSVRSDKQIKTFMRLARHLNGIGVHPIALKGISLLVGEKPGEPLRSSRITCDIDVLISRDALLDSLKVLKSADYKQLVDPLDKATDSDDEQLLDDINLDDFRNDPDFARAHVPPVIDSEGICIIDLHIAATSLHNPHAKQLTQTIVNHSVPVIDADSGVTYAIPDSVSQVVLAVYHAHIKNHHQFLGIVDWRLLLDMLALLQAHPKRDLVGETVSVARQLDMEREMFTAWKLTTRYLNADIELGAAESSANLRALTWFYRKSEWRWLAQVFLLCLKVKKAYTLLSPRELRQSLGARRNFSTLVSHLSYRIRRSLNS